METIRTGKSKYLESAKLENGGTIKLIDVCERHLLNKRGKEPETSAVKRIYQLINVSVKTIDLLRFSNMRRDGNKGIYEVSSNSGLTTLRVIKSFGDTCLICGRASFQALEMLKLAGHLIKK